MAGAHTMRYWYGGASRQRVALIGANSEADVFCNGDSVWQWNSATNIATRSSLPKADSASLGAPVFPAPMTYAALTPRQLSQRMLAAVGSDTSVSVETGPTVAGLHPRKTVAKEGFETAIWLAGIPLVVRVTALDAKRRDGQGAGHSYRRETAGPPIKYASICAARLTSQARRR